MYVCCCIGGKLLWCVVVVCLYFSILVRLLGGCVLCIVVCFVIG